MQLVLAIQDLEESLGEQRRELEELASVNQNLEVSVHEGRLRDQSLGKELALREDAIKTLEGKLDHGGSRNFEDMERELKELTDENMELIFKLNEATKELERRVVVVTDKRNGITIQELGVDPEEVDRLRNMIVELEKKLAATEEFHLLQHSSNEKLMVRLQMLIQGLKNANAELERQLRNSNRDLESMNEELVRERGALEGVRYENASCMKEQERLTGLVNDLSSRKGELEFQVDSLVSQGEKYENEIAELLVKLKFKQLNVKELEDRSLQLEMLNSGLEMKIQDSHELVKVNKFRILELEAQLGKMNEELRGSSEMRKELEAKVESLEVESEKAAGFLRSEQERNRAQIDALVRQIASVKVELNSCSAAKGVLEIKVSALEKAREELDSELERVKTESSELLETLTRFEGEARSLESELERLKAQKDEADRKVFIAEEQRDLVAARLESYKMKCGDLEKVREKQAHAERELRTQVEGLKSEVSGHLRVNSILENKVSSLENARKSLDSQLQRARVENSELMAMVKSSEADARSLESELENLKAQKVEAERRVFKADEQRELVAASLESYKVKCSGLEKVSEKQAHTERDLRAQVEGLKSEVSGHLTVNSILENKVSALERARESLDSQLQRARTENSELMAMVKRLEAEARSLESELEILKTQKDQVERRVSESEKQRELVVSSLENCKMRCGGLDSELQRSRYENSELMQKVANVEAEARSLESELEILKTQKDQAERRVSESEKQRELVVSSLESCKMTCGGLDSELQRSRWENSELMQKVASVEAEAHSLELGLESMKTQRIKAERRVSESEKQRELVAASLESYKVKCSGLENRCENQEMEFRTQVEGLKADVSDHLTARELLMNRIEELEKTLVALKVSNGDTIRKLEGRVSAYEKHNAQTVERKLELMAELESVQEELEACNSMKTAAENESMECLKQIEALRAALEESRKSYMDLEASQRQAREELEEQVREKSRLVDSLRENMLVLEKEGVALKQEQEKLMEALRDEAAGHRFSEETLQNRVKELEAMEAKLRLEQAAAEEQALHKQLELEDLRASISELEMKLEGQSHAHVLEREELESKFKELNGELSDYLSSKALLEDRIAELEESKRCMERIKDEKIGSLEVRVMELGSSINLLEKSSLQKSLVEQLEAERKLEELARELQAASQECSRLRIEKSQLEEQLSKAKEVESFAMKQWADDHLENAMKKMDLKEKLEQEKRELEKKSVMQVRLQELGSKLALQQNEELLQELENLQREYEQEQIQLEALRLKHEENEAALQNKIDYLEAAIERQVDAGLEQFQAELTRLQDQLSFCAQRERELVSKLNTQEILEKEIRRLEEDNEQLVETIARLKAASEWDEPQARIVLLESELNEALEANARYKARVENHSNESEAADVQSLDLMTRYKKRSSELEMDLKELQERFSGMSLQFAQVVAEKEQLTFELRSLQKSSEFLKKSSSF